MFGKVKMEEHLRNVSWEDDHGYEFEDNVFW